MFPFSTRNLRAFTGLVALLLLPFSARAPEAREAAVSSVAAPSARQVRDFQIRWQSALLDSRAGRYARAAHTLQALQPRDSLTSLYRASFLAESWLAAGQRKKAAQALDEVLNPAGHAAPKDPVWVRHLYRLRLQAYDAGAPAAERREFLARALRAPLEDGTRASLLYRLLDLDTTVFPARERGASLRQLVSLASSGAKLDSVYRSLAVRIPVGDTVWEDQKMMLDLEEKLGLWPKAIERGEAALARFPTLESSRSLQMNIALWYSNKGSYSESLKRYAQVRERYGESAELLLQTARTYRNLGQDSRAQLMYTRLAEQYPKDSRTAEVLWMRAFEDEASGHMEDAIEGYSQIVENFPQHARGPEAMFRIGLTYYKRGDFEAAQRAFRDLRTAQKTGRLAGAARYWEGKSQARRGDLALARATWTDLAAAYPFGYYGHQAERELTERRIFPDSLDWKQRFREIPESEVRAWMATVMSGTREAPAGFGQSPYLPLAKLVSLGMDTLALLTLQSQVNAAPSNPWLLYTAASLCHEAGFDYEGYRFGVKLSERLPLESWPRAPLSVLRLFYPPSYESIVRIEATRAGIAPWLVLALIKQESGFEPRAVSRVGARGLMQMMPATGAIQARKEKFGDFSADSLFVPRVNTRLGIAYLRDVLKRYDGNPYYALAHYNAGPTALERWLPRLQGRPPEESVEDIGYAETRDYVKRVMANYWTYQALWN